MKLTDGDYSDLVIYLANLFQKKNMKRFLIDRYTIEYYSCFVIDNLETLDGHVKTEFPEGDEIDRLRNLAITVSGINGNSSCRVEISWDSVVIEPDVHPKLAREFVDVLDRSTFRYF